MKPKFLVFTSLAFLILTGKPAMAQEVTSGLKIWFNTPAATWNDALPVGNGSLGGMIFGGIEKERIEVNEESVWTGKERWDANPNALKALPQVRRLLFESRYREAEELAQKNIMGAKPEPRASYQALGDIWLDFGLQRGVSDYRRVLDIENAVATVSYTANRVSYKREVFSSFPGKALVVRLTASAPGALTFTCGLTRPGGKALIRAEGNDITLSEHAGEGTGVKLFGRLRLVADGGKLVPGGDSIRIEKANTVTIFLTASTDYSGKDPVTESGTNMEAVSKQPFNEILSDHITDYQALFRRVDIDLGTSEGRFYPTDARITGMQNGYIDTDLLELYYQFGRYLLISSSRPGGLPANLQGIWADGLRPPWSADYHININIQMNYWPSWLTNLGELQEPFIDFIDALRPNASRTAKEVYGMKGIVAHYTTDVWHFTEPEGRLVYGMWPMGIAWSCQNIWDHYLFGGDVKYLRMKSYPIMKEAAIFCMDWLTTDPKTGYLVSGPSVSPENSFRIPGGTGNAATVMGPTMDHMIIRDLLRNTIRAATILDTDKQLARRMEKTLARLAPIKIGKDGRLMEWMEEFEEPEPGHRHISHLYGLHPASLITSNTPDLMDAARKTIDHRLANGGGHTGWSRAWIINFFARLKDGETAYENVLALLRKSTLSNLFDNHPPFQIDGNFGGTAGITEMLLQSHSGEVELLPALPSAWNTGHIHGIMARGGFETDIDWENGTLTRARIVSKNGNPLKLSYRGKMISMDTEKGKEYIFSTAELIKEP